MTMASDDDYYQVLGVSPNATTPEIRRAFRRLAREQHPDRNHHADGAERFRALADAYAVLNDPAERARYDRATRPSQAPQIRQTRPARGPVRAVLELSPREAQLAATGRLALTDCRGAVIVLPAGCRDGHQLTLHVGSDTVVLTVRTLSH
jgi:curved DNA-binding protein CbpA